MKSGLSKSPGQSNMIGAAANEVPRSNVAQTFRTVAAGSITNKPAQSPALLKAETVLYYFVRGSATLLPVVVLAGVIAGGWYIWSAAALIFGVYFLVELFLHFSRLGVGTGAQNEHQFRVKGRWPSAPIILYSILYFAIFPFLLLSLTRLNLELYELLGLTLSMGITAGSVGGLAGHELIHRKTPWQRRMGIAVYGSVFYAHFFVSHLRGHHRNVGLREDWSTARKNESSYSFLMRAWFHGFRGAWLSEKTRLKKNDYWILGPKNLVLRWLVLQVLWVVLLFTVSGTQGLLVWGGASLLAVTLMEMVNYLSHYGLLRESLREPLLPWHSWESNNKVTNWFIFNAGKHIHHHVQPKEEHHRLELYNDKPYLPFGLPLMTIIALVPPIYIPMMNRLLAKAIRQREHAEILT